MILNEEQTLRKAKRDAEFKAKMAKDKAERLAQAKQFACVLCGREKDLDKAIRPSKPFYAKSAWEKVIHQAGEPCCAICRNDDRIIEVES